MDRNTASISTAQLSGDTPSSFQQRDIATLCIYGLSLLSARLFLFLSLVNLPSPSPWQRYMGAIHGCVSLVAVVVVAYVKHLAFPLIRGNRKILPHMRFLMVVWSVV